MPILLINTIKKLVGSPQHSFTHKRDGEECYLCKNPFKYRDRYFEICQMQMMLHVNCLLENCKKLKIDLGYVGERDVLYIESPCKELINTVRYGKITYLQYIKLEQIQLKKEGRFPKLEILRNGFSCRLLIDKVESDWEY